MSLELPPLFASYIEAKNAHDARALAALFTDDGIVFDEGREIRGTDAIEAWAVDVSERYRLTTDPTAISVTGEKAVLTAVVSGTFPGSPLEFRFHFTLRDGKFASMRTEA
jgi:uncharacterized protein (TIGR02246 family)